MTRLLTAAVIVGALLAALALPWQAFAVLVALVGLLAWNEYARLAAAVHAAPASGAGAVLAILIIGSFAMVRVDAPLLTLLLAAALAALVTLRDHWADPRGAVLALGATFAGLTWIGLLLGCQVGLRRMARGEAWLVLLYASVAVGDAAAYYGGTRLGRRKLAPELSPNKTVEGSLFGLAGSAAAAAVVCRWIPDLSLPEAVVLGAILGLVGQAGDLVESALKRAAGVKDSSTLLPGHGGLLDRIDAHLPAGGLLYLVVTAGWTS